MKHLKIVQRGYEGFNGPLGRYEFKDGISVEKIIRQDRDQLAIAFEFLEINEDGTEEYAGIAHRMVAEKLNQAPVPEVIVIQTDEERAEEDRQVATRLISGDKKIVIHTRESLEKIAAKTGISGLRKIAEIWNVKQRSIPILIEMILAAQQAYQDKINAALASVEVEVAPVVEQEVEDEENAEDLAIEQAAARAQTDADTAQADADAEAVKIAEETAAATALAEAAAAQADVDAAAAATDTAASDTTLAETE